MAIWITRVLASEAGLRLRVEGQLVGDWCAVLERESHASCGQGRQVTLDLAGVSFADPRGLDTLRRLQSSGLLLANMRPLIAESLEDR